MARAGRSVTPKTAARLIPFCIPAGVRPVLDQVQIRSRSDPDLPQCTALAPCALTRSACQEWPRPVVATPASLRLPSRPA
eukprot:95957-Chlamydomonas_euryale.AAC.3